MVLTADLSGWPGEDGELVVGDFNLNDQHSIRCLAHRTHEVGDFQTKEHWAC